VLVFELMPAAADEAGVTLSPLRRRQPRLGMWRVIAKWRPGDPSISLSVEMAALEAADAESHGEDVIAARLHAAMEDVIRLGGRAVLPDVTTAFGSWRVQEVLGLSDYVSATERPPGGAARTISGSRAEVETALRAEGCVQSRYDKNEWLKG
jgi:hypothetical protein